MINNGIIKYYFLLLGMKDVPEQQAIRGTTAWTQGSKGSPVSSESEFVAVVL